MTRCGVIPTSHRNLQPQIFSAVSTSTPSLRFSISSLDGSRISTLDRARYVRNAAYSANKCRYAVTSLFEASGGSAIYDSFELQRIWRDVNAAAAHNAFMRDKHDPAFGRALLGLPASKFDRIGH